MDPSTSEEDEQRSLLGDTSPNPRKRASTGNRADTGVEDVALAFENNTFAEAAVQLVDAARASGSEVPPPTRAKWWKRWCCWDRTPDLPSRLESARHHVRTVAQIKMAPTGDAEGAKERALHEAYLLAVYQGLTLERAPSDNFEGEHWMAIGFQGSRPDRDLRGAGMLAVLQLLYLVNEHGGFAREMLKLSQVEAQNFPFATVSINMTALALSGIRSRRSHRLIIRQCADEGDKPNDHSESKERMQVLRLLNALYFGLMTELMLDWVDKGRNITDFQEVSEGLERRLLSNPAQFLPPSQAP